ncbi:hypothetical protein D1872_237180 [compost metagenome]
MIARRIEERGNEIVPRPQCGRNRDKRHNRQLQREQNPKDQPDRARPVHGGRFIDFYRHFFQRLLDQESPHNIDARTADQIDPPCIQNSRSPRKNMIAAGKGKSGELQVGWNNGQCSRNHLGCEQDQEQGIPTFKAQTRKYVAGQKRGE